jgi:putative Flp pilus-assembly TadE/G-like protein
MRIRNDEGGQMLVMLAVSLSALMGLMALAVDVGMLFHVRREVQIATDAAAAAGALDYHYNPSGSTARAAAQAAASQNGVINGSNGRIVNVTFPPSSSYSSPYSTGFVKAVVTVPNPTFFMKMFHLTSVNIVASAVAGPGASQGCVWALGNSGTDISGSGDLTASGCEIYDNSSSGTALDVTGGISAKQVGVTGGSHGTVNPSAITGMTPVRDPLSSLTAPGIPGSSGSGCLPQRTYTTGSHTLGSGCYDGISISGGTLTLTGGSYVINGNINVSGGASVTFNSGNYIINGNLAHSGSGTVTLQNASYTISGAMSNSGSGSLSLSSGQYVAEGGLQFTGSGLVSGSSVSFYTGGASTLSGSMNLTAPIGGAENGILVFQARGDGSTMAITESGSMALQGIVYAPSAPVGVGGSGSGNVYADFVVGSLNISGTPQLQNYASRNTTTPLTKIVMVQ